MKEKKRILAWIGIVLLLLAFCLPMVFAFGKGEQSQTMFRVSIGIAISVPILAYICLMAVRVFGVKQKKDGEIKNIVFDVGMVLIDFQWRPYLDTFGYPEETREKIAQAVFLSETWNERDKGEHEESYYVNLMVQNAPDCEKEIREVMEHVDKTIVPFDYSETWLRALKEQGYRLYILSNLSHFMLNRTKHRLSFTKYMDGMIYSCNERIIKPNPEIYRRLLNRYHLKPEETVFLDDRADNIEAAIGEGMHGIVFRNLTQADTELKALGVTIETV